MDKTIKVEKLIKSDAEWREILTPAQYNILRKEGTERAFTSPLNDEKRKGVFVCAGCELELFTSDMKFDSGTGWPSFFTVIEGRVETRLDFKMIYPANRGICYIEAIWWFPENPQRNSIQKNVRHETDPAKVQENFSIGRNEAVRNLKVF